jgi:hypothetical protein
MFTDVLIIPREMKPSNEDCKGQEALNGLVWISKDPFNPVKKEDSVESAGGDESVKGLIDGKKLDGGPRIVAGPNGARLTRENTIVPGCANCTGGRLISCARVGWTPFRCNGHSTKPSKISKSHLTYN